MNTLSKSTICCVTPAIVACITLQVSYRQDIEPILNDKCTQCHTSPDGIGYKKTGLKIVSYKSLMAGTIYGAVVLPGDSQRSIMNKLIEGRAGKLRKDMHAKGKALSHEEIKLFRLWVDQGALYN